MTTLPDIAAIRAAHKRIHPYVLRTPVLTSSTLNAEIGAQLFFKCENLQKVGAFKARGAANAVFHLTDDEAKRGVIAHSSGNHGAALAYAAARRGIPAWVVMPDNASKFKLANVRRYGATVHLCRPTIAAREAMCAEVQAATGATLVHPFDDQHVIAGQGTAALELLDEIPDLDAIVAPVGGGGLLSGTAIAAKALRPQIHAHGAEPANADDAVRSFRSGQIEPVAATTTIADGLRTTLSLRTLTALRLHVTSIGVASEGGIVRAMRGMWERMKIVVEPSAAVPLACLLERSLDFRGRRVGIIVSGGNVDLDHLPWQRREAREPAQEAQR